LIDAENRGGPLRLPAHRLRVDQDLGAGAGVGQRFMVLQRDVQFFSDVVQLGGEDIEDLSRDVDRIQILIRRRHQAIGGAGGVEDAPVEGGVVGGQEVHALEVGAYGRPKLAEAGWMKVKRNLSVGGWISQLASETMRQSWMRTTASWQAELAA
jgi:hypothetical protein